ncbi:MAG: MerR family transcriptional regulator [Acidobacteria bacterium]|nr:MerR family transcriptional regulator [Acidobacteriota bacterium]
MEAKKAHGPPPQAPPPRSSPDRRFLKIGEVCELTDTQPYVLRFWESEFPQLAPRKNRAGQRIYVQHDVDLVLRIKRLLYDEEFTIPGARKRLEEEGFTAGEKAVEARAKPAPAVAKAERGLVETVRALRKELRSVRDLLTRK